jgi:hypothetical protein
MTYEKDNITLPRAVTKHSQLAALDKSGMCKSANQLKDSSALELHDYFLFMTGHTAYYSTMLRRGRKRRLDYPVSTLPVSVVLRCCGNFHASKSQSATSTISFRGGQSCTHRKMYPFGVASVSDITAQRRINLHQMSCLSTIEATTAFNLTTTLSNMPLLALIEDTGWTELLLGSAALCTLIQLLYKIYSIGFGPLSKFPGPPLRAVSIIPTIWEMIHGRDASDHTALHNKYGPVVRTGPNRLSFAGGAQAWKDIYGLRKGHAPAPYKDRIFYKPPFNGAESILTAQSEAEHKLQRKTLSSGFSEKSLREQEPLLLTWATKLRDKLRERALKQDKIDFVEFYNFTTFDIMADLTFGESLNMCK